MKNTRSKHAEARMFRTSADRPKALLAQCPAYTPTPLVEQSELGDETGISKLYIKDESQRMQLGSFKALGGAYAVAQMIVDAAGSTDFSSSEVKSTAARMTFVTASAGNHGLSVAAGARLFGAQAKVFLSSRVPEGFADRIRSHGADVVRVDGTYEDSVSEVKAVAERDGFFLLADGSWDGYVERPALVMEGYTVIAEECRLQFSNKAEWPTHVFLQAGVGGFAAAIAGHIRDWWTCQQPEIIVVEPSAAPCLMESIKAGRMVRGDGPVSNMGRLDCKDASLIAFELLKKDADKFVTISDDEASAAVGLLARYNFKTTPSGAASFTALSKVALGANDRCLVFLTEGLE